MSSSSTKQWISFLHIQFYYGIIHLLRLTRFFSTYVDVIIQAGKYGKIRRKPIRRSEEKNILLIDISNMIKREKSPVEYAYFADVAVVVIIIVVII